MKVVIYLPSYETHEHFYKVFENFLSYKNHQVDIKLYVTSPIKPELLKPNVTVKYYEKSIAWGLTRQYIGDFLNDAGKYDIYMYCEDDILITESTFDTFIKENSKLPDDHVIGFLRYEEFNGGLYLDEWHPAGMHTITPKSKKVNDQWYFTVQNVHQACFVLEYRNLNKIIDNGNFTFGWGDRLEDAASNVYKGNWPGRSEGLEKVYPFGRLDNLLVHHLSNKYAAIDQRFLQFYQLKELTDKMVLLCGVDCHPNQKGCNNYCDNQRIPAPKTFTEENKES